MIWKYVHHFTSSRCAFLYGLTGLALAFLVNSDHWATNRVNFLKQSESDVEALGSEIMDRDKGSLRMAVRYYRHLRKFLPEEGFVEGNLGFCYYALGEKDKAVSAYQRAIELEPRFSFLSWDLAMIFFDGGSLKDAEPILDYVISNENVMRRYLKKLLEQILSYGRPDVIPLIEAMDKRVTDDVREAYIKLCESRYLRKEYALAQEAAQSGLKRFPGDRWLNYTAGKSAFMHKKWSDAVGYFSKAIAADPQDINSLYYRAQSLAALGISKDASLDLERAGLLHNLGVKERPFPKPRGQLHFNMQMLVFRYHLRKY